MAVCLTHPIDQTKIRTQTLPPNLRQNVLQTALTSIQDGGVKGLWTGLSASLLRQCTYGAARFGIYGWLKDRGSRIKGGYQVPLWVNGAIAGVAAGVVGAPAGKSCGSSSLPL
jgi:dicarboxylate transporter 10